MTSDTPPARPGGRQDRPATRNRRPLATFVLAAFLSFLFSPITAVFALVLGALVALFAWPMYLLGSARAKHVVYAAGGAIVGALPYFVVGVVVGMRAGS